MHTHHHSSNSSKTLTNMATTSPTLLLFFIVTTITTTTTVATYNEATILQMARTRVLKAKTRARSHQSDLTGAILSSLSSSSNKNVSGVGVNVALRDCVKLYEDSERRLRHMVMNKSNYNKEDAMTWVSAVMTNHRTCLDGLEQKGYVVEEAHEDFGKNLTFLLKEALQLYANKKKDKRKGEGYISKSYSGLLASWRAETSKADLTVAQDGSGSYTTITKAIEAVSSMGKNRPERIVIHVKSGVYNEKVNIGYKSKNVMLVGDGIDKTIVTGSKSVLKGSTTVGSASFDVSGDGFWARDMTFENTAGPENHQAVALKVSSDMAVFYRCSFKGYQDTLYVHSNRQFYRDSVIYGTVDFIFGDASVVFQNCDIVVRKPMAHQSNYITAQGRDDPNQPTGISIHNSRVGPTSDLAQVKGAFKTYLGRPWKKYSRTVFLKSDLDGLIDPKGWAEWSGSFGLSTLYYGEYMNIGNGASTENRVNWPGFHVLTNPTQARPFTVDQFLLGDSWIPATGVPFSIGI